MTAPRDIFVPPGGPPRNAFDQRELFVLLGEDTIRRMLSLFYENLSDSGIAHLFPVEPEAREAAAQRSADFFIQLMGGPPFYSERHGPPRMRMRHLPFEITTGARDLWLECFRDALDALPFPIEKRAAFENFLEEFSAWMVNTA